MKENPARLKAFNEAIEQFGAVRFNQVELPDEEKIQLRDTLFMRVRRHKQHRLYRMISAAAAVLLIGFVSALFFSDKGDSHAVALARNEAFVGQMLPEEDIYIVSGGKKINISGQSRIDLTSEGKVLVMDDEKLKNSLPVAKGQINKLVVPFGKRSELTFADGTHVWVNSGTEVDFPSFFTGNTREINVRGEIFLDVAHNPKIPFIVHAEEMNIHVHGTSFNVSAYHDNGKKSVVLVEGKVKIETTDNRMIDLSPNEKIEFADNRITKDRVDVSPYISWTKGILEFNETPLSEIFKTIGRYYNVQFKSGNDMKLNNKTCSGKLFLSNNLDSVMISVSALSSTIYRRENNIIHITKK